MDVEVARDTAQSDDDHQDDDALDQADDLRPPSLGRSTEERYTCTLLIYSTNIVQETLEVTWTAFLAIGRL